MTSLFTAVAKHGSSISRNLKIIAVHNYFPDDSRLSIIIPRVICRHQGLPSAYSARPASLLALSPIPHFLLSSLARTPTPPSASSVHLPRCRLSGHAGALKLSCAGAKRLRYEYHSGGLTAAASPSPFRKPNSLRPESCTRSRLRPGGGGSQRERAAD